jgi:hypothetical protein
MIDLEEYRLLNGWSEDRKRGSTRSDRIPTDLVEEYIIDGKEGYKQLIPVQLEEAFTVKDYKKASGISLKASQIALHVLNYVGAIEKIGKNGRSFVYRRAS